MSWLKAEAPLNIMYIILTPEVSHAPMSSLKDDPENNSDMSVTPEVFHALMSSLKDILFRNKAYMSVTPDVSHVEI